MAELAVTLPALPESIPVARHVLDRLAGSLETGLFEDLRLLVSEVVTNSIRHGPGGPGIELRVLVDQVVRVEVEDLGPGFDPPVFEPRPERDAGWGLMLVDLLADRWGVSSSRGTTIVWFEFDRSA